jgi:predicted transcriptional regulator
MRPLWQRGECTVADVQEALQGQRDLAATTIATILSRLEKQGLVAHRKEGRQYVYRAVVSESEVRRSTVSDVVRHLFHGDPAELVSHLLRESEMDPDDLAQVKALIEAREKEDRDDAGER